MQRFFLQNVKFEDNIILKDEEKVYQLIKVLRIKSGELVVFFDGINAIDYTYEVINIGKKEILFKLLDSVEKYIKNNLKINLFQALPNKLSKIELIIAKGVEVGINSFNFFRSERSQDLKISDNKVNRLKKIIVEAVEQSGRSYIPELKILKDLETIQNFVSTEKLNLFFHTKNKDSLDLKEFRKINYEEVNIFVGPEGGWSDNEVEDFEKLGYKKVYLGENILRTETVGIVVGFYFNNY